MPEVAKTNSKKNQPSQQVASGKPQATSHKPAMVQIQKIAEICNSRKKQLKSKIQLTDYFQLVITSQLDNTYIPSHSKFQTFVNNAF